jgi:glutaminase
MPASHKNITATEVKTAVQNAYDKLRSTTGGKNASYIPYLAQVDPNLFGISVCLLDGTIISVGDAEHTFGIESVSKVPTAILAMREYGALDILEKVGADATGLPFNSIMALLLEKDRPSSPLVNAGAIAACSLVEPVGNEEEKWKAIVGNITQLTGREPQVIQELYASESASDFNNRSIAWLLKDYGRIYDDPDLSLDLYTRQCSLGTTARDLAVMAATVNPSCSATSRVCRPMDPVEPKIEIVFVIVPSLFYYRKLKIISITGATNSTLSKRSSTPPWARKRCP